jgi:hypothetical protein
MMADDFANIAYGFLWLDGTEDREIHRIRQLLLAVIGPEGQKNGITQARLMMGVNGPRDHGLELRDPLASAVRHAIEYSTPAQASSGKAEE